ncbi:hypothetical protein D3C78_1090970 [compost metagenome]
MRGQLQGPGAAAGCHADPRRRRPGRWSADPLSAEPDRRTPVLAASRPCRWPAGADRPLAAAGAAQGAPAQGRRARCAGADPGRDRYRQGAGGARLPRLECPPRRAVPRAELRGAAGKSRRERVVRLCRRRLHWRPARRQAGPAGAGRSRHGIPRRSSGDVAVPAGQVAALPQRRLLPPHRRRPRVACRCAGALRHPPQPGADGQRRRFPRGPLLPPQRAQPVGAAAA